MSDPTKYSYKLIDGESPNYGLDVLLEDGDPVDEGRMAAWVPFADGNRRDGVGDVLDVEGIDTSRHRKNPIVLFDHAKDYKLPIGVTEDPNTHDYVVEINPVAKRARALAFFYKGLAHAVAKESSLSHGVFCEQVFDLLAKRFLRAGSIGYQVIQSRDLPPEYDKGIPSGKHLLKVKMLEISVVVLPANADTVKSILAMPKLCGKPVSPYLVKSLSPYVGDKKVQLGYEGKSVPQNTEVTEIPRGQDHTKTNVPPVAWKPGANSLPNDVKKLRNKHRSEKPREASNMAEIQTKDAEGKITREVKEDPKFVETPAAEPEEPYGAQVVRRVHSDYVDLMREYDEMLGVLEHAQVKKQLIRVLQQIEKEMQEAEKIWDEHYGTAGLKDLDGRIPAEEETKDGDDVGEDKEKGSDGEEQETEDEDEGAEKEGEEGEGEEAEDNSREELDTDGTADSSEDVETPPEEAVAAMGIVGKRLPLKDVKTLRKKYRHKEEKVVAEKPKEVPKAKKEVKSEKAELKGKKKNHHCGDCDQSPCVCHEPTASEDASVAEGHDEFDAIEDAHEQSHIGGLTPEHRGHVHNAASFLQGLSQEGAEFTRDHQLEAFHHAKMIDSIKDFLSGGHAETKDLEDLEDAEEDVDDAEDELDDAEDKEEEAEEDEEEAEDDREDAEEDVEDAEEEIEDDAEDKGLDLGIPGMDLKDMESGSWHKALSETSSWLHKLARMNGATFGRDHYQKCGEMCKSLQDMLTENEGDDDNTVEDAGDEAEDEEEEEFEDEDSVDDGDVDGKSLQSRDPSDKYDRGGKDEEPNDGKPDGSLAGANRMATPKYPAVGKSLNGFAKKQREQQKALKELTDSVSELVSRFDR